MGPNRDREGGATTSGPHEFVPPDDSRIGLALGSGQASGRSVSSIGMAILAGESTRPLACALCGKERRDPIHWPTD